MLDTKTVAFMLAVAAILASTALFLLNRRHLPVPGVGAWTLGNAICAIGLVLSLARATLPDLFGIVLSNALMLVSVSCLVSGYRRYVGLPGALWPGLALSAVMTGLLALFTFQIPSIANRVVTMSLGLGLLCLAGSWPLLRPGVRPRLVLRCCGTLHLLLALFYLGRAGVAWGTVIPDYFTAGSIALWAHLAGFIQFVLGTFLQLALIAEWLVADIERQASRDPLTTLLNRRAFATIAGKVLAATIRADRPAAALMLDLDHFKRANDSRGHAFGDELLCCFARVAEAQLRTGDVFCRHGGEEFAILLPDTDAAQAFVVAERLRRAFAADPCAGEVAATVSIGIAIREDGADLDDLLRRADRALYRAKNEGRNRCVLGG